MENGRSTPNGNRDVHDDVFERRMNLNQRQRELKAEIQSVEDQAMALSILKRDLKDELELVTSELEEINRRRTSVATTADLHGLSRNDNLRPDNTSHNANRVTGVNYFDQDLFEWSKELKKRMKNVFGFDNFRLCQEGICNASMDNRDVVAVMPTGGGKSLTYQLPALLCSGTTLVISPLIALITDQILHLHEAGIDACMLTGSASKEEQRSILQRLVKPADSGKKISSMDANRDGEIKLIYVTPEKIAKSKTFLSTLQKMANNGKLVRIVIDEAHCVSQLGHDFRPDYQKLSILRQLFPHVPILALSATCPPKVLKDLLNVLKMPPVVDGNSAPAKGTVYFSSPLYRKNLHYKVLPKPASAPAVIEAMANYITQHHSGETGIVYCLSKKDAETVAAGIQEVSGSKIRTGVYHADIGDAAKETLHKKWRKGEVKVVCATIAFGLGIDKGDVRFVLHHSMSKSLDGFYQESGRAGRDGNDSDCILFYRGQDVSRLSALVCGEREGQEKLHDMLRFAQDLHECRKIQFAKYFSASSSLDISAWSTEGSDALSRCQHCDNCTRPPESIDSNKDVTLEAWKILKVVQTIHAEGGRTTLGMLADLVRGAGGGAFEASGGRGKSKGQGKQKTQLDLEAVCHGKVDLRRDDAESLLITLLLLGYLKEEYVSTSYTINVYLVPGNQAFRLSRLSLDDIKSNTGPRIKTSFLKETRKKRAVTAKDRKSGKTGDFVLPSRPRKPSASTSKGAGEIHEQSSDDSEGSAPDLSNNLVLKPSQEGTRKRAQEMPKQRGSSFPSKRKRVVSSEEEDNREDFSMDTAHDLDDFIVEDDAENPRGLHDEETVPDTDEDWDFSFAAQTSSKRQTAESSGAAKKRPKISNSSFLDRGEIIELSD